MRKNYTETERYEIDHFVPDKQQVNRLKLFPKTCKALGTISACPQCGRKGQLSMKFSWDSPTDGYEKRTDIRSYRDLNYICFRVLHIKKRNGKNVYVGSCTFASSYWDELDALLLHGRSIPDGFRRVLFKDVYGRGFDRFGRRIWRANQ